MNSSFLRILRVCFFVLALSACVLAQSPEGNTGGTGSDGGSTGGTGSGGYTSGNSSGYTTSSSSSNSGSSVATDFGTTIEMPEFQGFDTSSQEFVGRDSSVPFIGREEAFGDRQTAASAKRTTATTSTPRRTTSSRMTTSRAASGRTGLSSANNGRTVRASTEVHFSLSPMEVRNRTTEFQTRITRLPNLRVVPEQIGVTLESTPLGNVATLTGTVPSERERKVMKQLLLLEPGIDKVENKLTVNEN